MRHCFLLFGLSFLLLTGAQAQVSGLAVASESCAAAHAWLAQAHRPAAFTRDHERLMHRYDAQWARLDLFLERDTNQLGVGSNVLTRARNRSVTAPLDTIGFELHPSLTLDSVVVDGRRVPPARVQVLPDGAVRVRPTLPVMAGATFQYQVWYHGTPVATAAAPIAFGLKSLTDPTWGNDVTANLSEPFDAYAWWPCKQVLGDKLDSVAVWVTTAADNRVGSNGVLRRTVALPGGQVRYEWASSYPIDYYLVSVAVARYVDYTTYAHPTSMPTPGDSIPIVNYVFDNPAALPSLRPQIDLAAPLLEFYSATFGLYPFWREKYGHSMAPIGGGMEHQTMTTQQDFNALLTAHEMTHQWFGDWVTCRSWRDIWLNESFATYGEYLALPTIAPTLVTRWLDITRRNGLQPTGSVRVPAADTLNPTRIFSGRLSYAKGALVIHMLRHLINDDAAFLLGLRTYLQQYGYGTATTADLQMSLETSLGRPLDWFFNQWIDGEGYAQAAIRWNQVGQNLILESAQTATAPAITPFFRMPLEFDYKTPGGTSTTVRLEQTQPTQRWVVALPTGLTVDSVKADPRRWNALEITQTTHDPGLVNGLPPDVVTAPAVYPNPCTDFLRLTAAPAPRTAEILDLTGRCLSRTVLPAAAGHLTTTALPAGTYLLRLTGSGAPMRPARFSKQ